MIALEPSFLSKKVLFEKELSLSIKDLCEKNTLRDACEYALMNGGKRFRPLIVQSLGDALCPGSHITKAALAIEYFHTASLIADDLPCMDDDRIRRDKPSLHVAFGETIALLASYALISEAYKKIHEAGVAIKSQNLPFAYLGPQICFKAFEVASSSSGLSGATLGQYYDLFPKTNSLTHLEKTIDLKTITLFRSAFSFGWLFGGGDLKQMPLIERLAHHFGFSFQMMDDVLDLDQDAETSKLKNLAWVLGKEKVLLLIEKEMGSFKEISRSLGIYTPEISMMVDLLMDYAFTSSKT